MSESTSIATFEPERAVAIVEQARDLLESALRAERAEDAVASREAIHALELLLSKHGGCKGSELAAAEMRLRCEWHIGDLLGKPMTKGEVSRLGVKARSGETNNQCDARTGIPKERARDYRKLAKVPQRARSWYLDRCAVHQEKPTTAKASSLWRLGDQPEPVVDRVLEMLSDGEAKTCAHALMLIKREGQDAEAQALPDKPTVYHCSAADFFERDPEPCDLLLTDPPYMTDVDDIESFVESWLPHALDLVKTDGRAYVCVGAYPRELRAYLNADHRHMALAQVLVWTYRNTIGPATKVDYKLNWQAILYFRGPDAPPLEAGSLNELFSVQDIAAPDGRHGNRYHEWQKPDELGDRFVRHATKPGGLVYDPFCCTGTFVLAAHRLGRRAVGCDISAENLAIAETRGCRLG